MVPRVKIASARFNVIENNILIYPLKVIAFFSTYFMLTCNYKADGLYVNCFFIFFAWRVELIFPIIVLAMPYGFWTYLEWQKKYHFINLVHIIWLDIIF